MFTTVNTQNLKQIQVPQEEIQIERRNLEMEIRCVKPQILLHLNKVPTSIGFKRSIDLTISSKVRLLRSRQIKHIKKAGTIFQILEECFPGQFHQPKRREVTVFSITHYFRHHPLDSKYQKNFTPQGIGKLTMEQKMIHSFLITPAHATPINQW